MGLTSRCRSGVEHNPALAGALPPEGAHVRPAADQPGEDPAGLVPDAHAGAPFAYSSFTSRAVLRRRAPSNWLRFLFRTTRA